MKKNRTQEPKAVLIEGPVGKTLIWLTIPMIFGMVGIVAFNLVDTFFVGKLGTDELAALGFTFPVVLVIGSLAMGLGIGSSAVISRAVGEGNHHQVKRLTTDSLILAFLLVAFFALVGIFTINPLFRLLGATEVILPLIRKYMSIWYLGMIFVVIPMVGNNAIRAVGDTKTPGIIMMVAAVINTILDPLLIFGIGPFPRLEIAGAAIATVIARALTLIVALYVLSIREKMISVERAPLRAILDSWRKILYIGLPTAGTLIIIPVGMGLITRLLSSFGPESVAAFGVSSRIEFFALTVVRALSTVLAPFIGQNWGASRYDRAVSGVKYSKLFSIFWGGVLYIGFLLLAKPIASIFNSDTDVIRGITLYLRIVPLGYGLQGILLLAISALNVLRKPLHASFLRIAQMFVVFIPLAFLGSALLGVPGIFAALTISYCMIGAGSSILLNKIMYRESVKNP